MLMVYFIHYTCVLFYTHRYISLCKCIHYLIFLLFRQAEMDRAVFFLGTMGLKVATEVKDVPISLSYQEAKEYGQIFRTFDKDNDGHISIHDLRKALSEMGEKVSDDKLRELIAEVDINKNCTIEEEEFLQVSYYCVHVCVCVCGTCMYLYIELVPLLALRYVNLCVVLDSIVVSISACHAEDPGSIPGR